MSELQCDMYTTFTLGCVCGIETRKKENIIASFHSVLKFEQMEQLETLLPSDVPGGRVLFVLRMSCLGIKSQSLSSTIYIKQQLP